MRILLDVSGVENKEALHRAVRETLCLPAWYGENLDALHDCLTERTEETELVICGGEQLERTLGGYARSFRRVLLDSAAENPALCVVWKE